MAHSNEAPENIQGEGSVISHHHFDIDQNLILERVVFHPPLRANGTMHDEACFLFAVKGQSRIYSAIENHALNSDDGVIMKCGNYLNSWVPLANNDPCEALAIHFKPEVFRKVFQDSIPDFLNSKTPVHSVSIQKVHTDEMIRSYVNSLQFYFENPSLVNEALIILKVKELIMLLVNSDTTNQVKSILQDLFNPVDYDFKEVIKKNLFEDLTVDDLAVITNLSVSSFKRKFKEVFGDSPASYIKSKRLEKAADLLKVTSQRITDICYDCGFGDTAHFSKSFAAQYNLSPSEYRKQFEN